MYVLECTINGDKSYVNSTGVGLATLVTDIKDATFYKDLKGANYKTFLTKKNELFNLKLVEIEKEKPNFKDFVEIEEVK